MGSLARWFIYFRSLIVDLRECILFVVCLQTLKSLNHSLFFAYTFLAKKLFVTNLQSHPHAIFMVDVYFTELHNDSGQLQSNGSESTLNVCTYDWLLIHQNVSDS